MLSASTIFRKWRAQSVTKVRQIKKQTAESAAPWAVGEPSPCAIGYSSPPRDSHASGCGPPARVQRGLLAIGSHVLAGSAEPIPVLLLRNLW